MVSVKHEGADVGLIVIEPAGAAGELTWMTRAGFFHEAQKQSSGCQVRSLVSCTTDAYLLADVPPQGAVAASGSGFRVWLLAARSVQQLLALHLAESQWDEALRLATAYGLDADEVYRWVGWVGWVSGHDVNDSS
jgi:hypothetical protein